MFSGRRKSPATKAAVAGALTVGAGVLGLSSAASAAEPTQQELLEQIKALQNKVEQLEARQDQQAEKQQGATTRPAAAQAEPEATIGSVLRDAERRSNPVSLQAGGFTAGYSKNKFLIQDEAGNFVLNPNIQFQFRHVANYREEDNDEDATDPSDLGDGETDSSIESGFEVRRLKFAFDGSVFGPALTYKFQWATNRGNGNPVLDDAWVRVALGNVLGDGARDFAVRIGQFKDPTFHEEMVSSKRQLAADRSLVNEVIGGGLTDWVQGVALIWDDGPEGSPLRAEVGFSDGINTDNTPFTDAGGAPDFGAGNPDWGAFARVEYLASGSWKQYDDFTALDTGAGTENLLAFGVGASYTETSGAGGGDTILYTADAQYETGKLHLYGAFYGIYGESAEAQSGGHNDTGVLVQAGYLLSEKLELFGRYDVLMVDDKRFEDALAEDTYSEITFGLNYYIRGHAAKFTVDVNYLPAGSPNDQTGIGYLGDDNDEDQFAIRSQFQLLL